MMDMMKNEHIQNYLNRFPEFLSPINNFFVDPIITNWCDKLGLKIIGELLLYSTFDYSTLGFEEEECIKIRTVIENEFECDRLCNESIISLELKRSLYLDLLRLDIIIPEQITNQTPSYLYQQFLTLHSDLKVSYELIEELYLQLKKKNLTMRESYNRLLFETSLPTRIKKGLLKQSFYRESDLVTIRKKQKEYQYKFYGIGDKSYAILINYISDLKERDKIIRIDKIVNLSEQYKETLNLDEFPMKAQKIFNKEQIHTIAELLLLTGGVKYSFRGLGDQSLKKIRRVLEHKQIVLQPYTEKTIAKYCFPENIYRNLIQLNLITVKELQGLNTLQLYRLLNMDYDKTKRLYNQLKYYQYIVPSIKNNRMLFEMDEISNAYKRELLKFQIYRESDLEFVKEQIWIEYEMKVTNVRQILEYLSKSEKSKVSEE